MRKLSTKFLYQIMHAELDPLKQTLQIPVHIAAIRERRFKVRDDVATVDINELSSCLPSEDCRGAGWSGRNGSVFLRQLIERKRR